MMKCMVCDKDMVDTVEDCPYCQIRLLKEALEKHGQHKNDCAYIQGLKGNTIEDCDCGFEQARKGD